MALPSPNKDQPVKKVKLPSSKLEVTVRGFLMKEMKILLIAKSSDKGNLGKNEIFNIRQVIENCTFGEVKVDAPLTPIDLEYLIIQMRILSKGKISEIPYRCQNKVQVEKNDNDKIKKCNTVNTINIDLEKDIEFHNLDSNEISLSNDNHIGIVFKQIDINKVTEFNMTEDKVFDDIISLIDYIWYNDDVFYAKDHSVDELKNWLDELTDDQFLKITDFFNSPPQISTKAKYKCKSCGYEEEITIKGLDNFF